MDRWKRTPADLTEEEKNRNNDISGVRRSGRGEESMEGGLGDKGADDKRKKREKAKTRANNKNQEH